MSKQTKTNILIFLASMSAGIILISNLCATKLWDLFGIAVDGGVVLFPLSYIIGDLIVEFYGKKTAKTVIWSSFSLNILAAIIFWIVIGLPQFPGWDMQESFSAILGFVPRIVFGSLIAYVISSLLNNHLFIKIKEKTGEKNFLVRALGSSVVAHFFDTAIFETIAFLGVLPFNDFLAQAGFAYVLAILFEAILSPIELGIVSIIKNKLKIKSAKTNE